LRDRVLQKLILLSILPVLEFQADSNSFSFRNYRTTSQAVRFLQQLLIKGFDRRSNFVNSRLVKKR